MRQRRLIALPRVPRPSGRRSNGRHPSTGCPGWLRRRPRPSGRGGPRPASTPRMSRETTRRYRSLTPEHPVRCASACRSAPTPPSGRSRQEPGAGGTARLLRRLPLRLDGAFALAPDDGVGLGPAPVDEVLQRLEVELDRQSDALRGLLEWSRPDAIEELVERL